MDKRVYFLMIISFVVGMVELIIGGILDLIAADLHVSLGQAGFLITIFSLIFAIAAPILLILTARIERKRLTLISLVIFLLGNMITVFSPSYGILFTGRVVSAISGALLIILCLTMAPSIVDPKYRGRAIGIVSMGVSASLVLGIPIGLMLGNLFNWRAPFILISMLTALSIAAVYFFMGRVEPRPSIPIKKQLATLKDRKIFFAQATTFLFMAGHTTLYAYLTPFVKTAMGLEGTWISIIYLIFGVAAVSGGGLGGTLADLMGTKRTILAAIIVFGLAIFAIPYTTFYLPLFLVVMIIWGAMSWAISPAMQSYLIETSPDTSDIQQSLNNSALHLGIAIGSLIGGVVIEQASVERNAGVGGLLVIVALGTALISMREGLPISRKYKKTRA
ncbi:MFS transporter [Virgibacillus dakarensis]|uniref:Chloramphenicol resistance protein n=1 Tax=Lentibacillus populi TaxID=1827502 RepID=A0A9W5U189_9BACI|nr:MULTISPECIES: MFS transporter [Bacillaceae]MBT2216964.1 MFS transporter [Virgibacillus dakarensis]MTW87894.1 MFS transporter [Virgibacillus dakarensis]GGB58754.1 chloramphenicol resistance protein [Lentibacillus populi]